MEVQEYSIDEEPLYLSSADEIEVYTKAFANKLPVLLKGPTGCGKTRFIEYMAWRLEKPLITVSCHDDLSTSDLVGRYLLKDNETAWIDGPLTRAVRYGCICYLDEIVEARKDTTVVIHPLCDDRRLLAIEKRGELISADDNFCMTVSYNPGYQSVLKKSETKYEATVCGNRIQLSELRNRAGNFMQGNRHRRRNGKKFSPICGNDAQFERQRLRRRCQHSPFGARRKTHCNGHRCTFGGATLHQLCLKRRPPYLKIYRGTKLFGFLNRRDGRFRSLSDSAYNSVAHRLGGGHCRSPA